MIESHATTNKTIAIAAVVILIVAGVVIFRGPGEEGGETPVIPGEKKEVNLEQLTATYQSQVNGLMGEYQALLEDGNTQDATALKEKLLNLTLPKEFRDLHVELVLLLDQVADGVDVAAVRERFAALAAEYEWLNHE